MREEEAKLMNPYLEINEITGSGEAKGITIVLNKGLVYYGGTISRTRESPQEIAL